MKQLKPIALEYEDYIKDVTEKMKPDSINIEVIQAKIQNGERIEFAELAVWNKFNADVEHCAKEELEKKNQVTFQPLSEDGFNALLASNDFKVSEILILDEVLSQ